MFPLSRERKRNREATALDAGGRAGASLTAVSRVVRADVGQAERRGEEESVETEVLQV